MAKSRVVYVCQACGAHQPRWLGQCPSCGEWNSLEETVSAAPDRRERPTAAGRLKALPLGQLDSTDVARLATPMPEWDRVLGGGIVPGAVVLVGGDPGVGKSTLLMQVADGVGAVAPGGRVLYVSGEESLPQVSLRARRLGLAAANVHLAAETDLGPIVAAVEADPPQLLVVDSIQSVYDPTLDSPPGSIVQLRECTLQLLRVAKQRSVAMALIGHVTKEGVIAGPRALEHMVDVVLYLEGERLQAYRLLRSVKNRFGATSEVGVFQMAERGLSEVRDPSSALLEERVEDASGSAVAPVIEGTRPMLVEVQALVTRSFLTSPRRVTSGIDFNRVLLIAAVLSKRARTPLHEYDIHVNVVGGLRLEEPAADLATALAILSSLRDAPLDPRTVVVGEIGLAGELRGAAQLELRLREAARLGFGRAIVPRGVGRAVQVDGMEVIPASAVTEAARLAGIQ